jgi:peptidoglycan/xylan/chitin deacetylase (PgdA/CDA1 family)
LAESCPHYHSAASSVLVANFPTLDVTPDPSFGIGAQILASVDLSNVPDIPVTDGTCAGSPTNAANAEANHWWTCGGWTASTDVTVCPNKDTWGLSYDDGPSPYTPTLLDYLDDNNLKSTFFIVGSRAISRPDLLTYEYMNGHQLSVHTWSHPPLTNMTNEQIVLELGWTKEVIRQITGVTPNTMRPPYGDIDDRVRAICKAMDLTPIIWTSVSPTVNYDTEDWKIGAGEVSAAEVVSNFDTIIANSSNLDTGYIVLEHDLYTQSVQLAVEVVLPAALAKTPKQTLKPIVECLNLPLQDAYIETNSNTTGSGGADSFSSSSSSSSSAATSSSTGSSINSSGGLGSSSSSDSSSNSKTASTSGAATSVTTLSTLLAMSVVAVSSLMFCLL